MVFYLFLPLAITEAAEPLRGPELKFQGWTEKDNENSDAPRWARERSFNADIPIPVPLWIAMPYATLRLSDRETAGDPHYLSDHKLGLGLLHHAAEGDPAWRLDIIRGGPPNSRPSLRSRFIASLIKPFPWLRIRPSDNVVSWLGLNYLTRPSATSLVIPELAWYRKGSEGFVIDLLAPKHFFMGVSGQMFGIHAGVEQDWSHWEPQGTSNMEAQWTLQRLARLKMTVSAVTEWILSTSLLYSLDLPSSHKKWGGELAIQWNPVSN